MIDFQAIKSAISMPRLLSIYGMEITPNNKAVCPFHDDQRPSMHIYKDGYYCFACGCGGDVVSFIARFEGITNKQAALRASEIAGINPVMDSYHARERMRLKMVEKQRREQKKEEYRRLCDRKRALANVVTYGVPYSEEWCAAASEMPEIEWELDYLFKELA